MRGADRNLSTLVHETFCPGPSCPERGKFKTSRHSGQRWKHQFCSRLRTSILVKTDVVSCRIPLASPWKIDESTQSASKSVFSIGRGDVRRKFSLRPTPPKRPRANQGRIVSELLLTVSKLTARKMMFFGPNFWNVMIHEKSWYIFFLRSKIATSKVLVSQVSSLRVKLWHSQELEQWQRWRDICWDKGATSNGNLCGTSNPKEHEWPKNCISNCCALKMQFCQAVTSRES